jgi:hypothetical protein
VYLLGVSPLCVSVDIVFISSRKRFQTLRHLYVFILDTQYRTIIDCCSWCSKTVHTRYHLVVRFIQTEWSGSLCLVVYRDHHNVCETEREERVCVVCVLFCQSLVHTDCLVCHHFHKLCKHTHTSPLPLHLPICFSFFYQT